MIPIEECERLLNKWKRQGDWLDIARVAVVFVALAALAYVVAYVETYGR